MKRIIDITSWNRKELFEHFHSMNDPFTGVTANVECKKAYYTAKEMKTSFWLYYLHKSLIAANNIEEFRYRIEDKTVVCYEKIHAGTTIDNSIKTFSIALLHYHENYADFSEAALSKIEMIRTTSKMALEDELTRPDCIHYTTLPWVKFTALKHACHVGVRGSAPKISFGKYFEENGKLWLPVSVEVNHALMDGRQIGAFYEYFQTLLNQ